MADDWQPGDLALCIKQGPWINKSASGLTRPGFGPPCGRILKVRSVIPCSVIGIALRFMDWPDREALHWIGYNAQRFRKIRPHKPDEEDAETIRLLNGVPARENA